MGILVQCPICKTRQSVKKKVCQKCGQDMDKAKKARQVTYWISYRLPNGKQKQEAVGESIDDARAADGKKRGQRKEGKLFDIREDATMTFREFTNWYLDLSSVKKLKSSWRIEIALRHFNDVYGDTVVSKIKASDFEDYQAKRKADGKADHTIDHEIGAVKGMINKAFDNGMVSMESLSTFKKPKKLLKRNSNVRDRILTHEEYEALCSAAPLHLRNAIIIGYHTGMRRGEILKLTWKTIDMKARIITIPKEITKDNEERKVPISDPLYATLCKIPKALHDDHVILFKGKPLDVLGRALGRACQKAGITYGRGAEGGFTFHDIRHTFNTNMRKAGVAESVIMAITGHSTREMFDRYNTVDETDTRHAVKSLEVFFENVTQNVNKASNGTP
jgi:integrase